MRAAASVVFFQFFFYELVGMRDRKENPIALGWFPSQDGFIWSYDPSPPKNVSDRLIPTRTDGRLCDGRAGGPGIQEMPTHSGLIIILLKKKYLKQIHM